MLLHYPVCIVLRTLAIFWTLRHKHNGAVFALSYAPGDKLLQLVNIRVVLRNYGCLCSRCNCAVLCKKAGISAHNLYKKDSVVTGCGIPDFVYAIYNCIQSSVVTYCGVCAVEVIIYGARQAYARYVILFGELHNAGKRTVAAYYYECIYVVLHQIIVCSLSALWSHKLRAAGSL